MTLSTRATCALLVFLAVAAPSRAPAQDAEAWVLPRGLLELSASGLFTSYDTRLGWGDPALGSEFVGPLQLTADRLTVPATAETNAGLTDFFASVADPDPTTGVLPEALTPGRLALRFTADERRVPFILRYGLTSRLTLSLLMPLERRGTSVIGPYLAGGTLGINPARAVNAAVLDSVDQRFAALGGGLFLPVAGSPEGIELQERLRAIDPADTLTLPTTPVTIAQLLADEATAALLTDEEIAALGLTSGRSPYQLGDMELGARFLLLRGPAGWPYPDSVTGLSLRTSVGARVRFPTGKRNATFLTEIPPSGGHFGIGVDLLNDIFISSRWYVNASGSLDVLFPTDVQRLAFSTSNLFPADTAVRTFRREPGPQLAVNITPRWRLTDEISFSGEYALLARQRVEFVSDDPNLRPTPLEWRTGGSMHALGIGARYSSLQAFARGRADVPFEVTLSVSRAVAGAGLAPEATTVRLTGRIFVDPRRFARLLPGEPPPPDTSARPAPQPTNTVPKPGVPPAVQPSVADTLPPSAPPEIPAGPRVVVPPQPDTVAGDTIAVPPSVPPQASTAARAPGLGPRVSVAYHGGTGEPEFHRMQGSNESPNRPNRT